MLEISTPAPVHALWRDLWLRIAIEGAGLLLVYFVAWDLAEGSFLASQAASHLRALHLVRGIGGALMLGTWSFLRIRSRRAASDAAAHDYTVRLEALVRHQEKMAGLGMLTAGFAHDLGNPLASLSTELELLEGETDLAQVHDSLAVLGKHVARMSRTLREMVDFARRRRDEVADVSIAAAVSDSARLVHHDPRWRKVDLRIELPNDLPAVHMVEDHLVLVLVNLMLNAADAMPSGGVLNVTATCSARGDDVVLRIRDTGTGMTPEVLARAKAPLFTTKGATRGTGLGLAVSDGIVRSVGGTLELTSAPGAGTEVAIRLPARIDARG